MSFLPFYSGELKFIYPYTKSLFSRICHGIDSRCFHIDGLPLHLCARCLGIYSGLLSGSITALFIRKRYDWFLSRYFLLIAVIPIGTSKLLEWTGIIEYSLWGALISGFLSGYILFLYISNRFLFNYQYRVND